MPWQKNDFFAAFIIVGLLAIGLMIVYINWEQVTLPGITWHFK